MYRNANHLSQDSRYQLRRSFVLESDYPEGKTTFLPFSFLFRRKNHFYIEINAIYALYIEKLFPSMLLLHAYLSSSSCVQRVNLHSPGKTGEVPERRPLCERNSNQKLWPNCRRRATLQPRSAWLIDRSPLSGYEIVSRCHD
jgi:hypothetical protein